MKLESKEKFLLQKFSSASAVLKKKGGKWKENCTSVHESEDLNI